jgi:hypothetical protein
MMDTKISLSNGIGYLGVELITLGSGLNMVLWKVNR